MDISIRILSAQRQPTHKKRMTTIMRCLPAIFLWYLVISTCIPELVAAAPVAALGRRRNRAPPPISKSSSSSPKSTAAWLDGLKNGLASAMAAACVKTSLQPIDAMKTLQQYQIAKGAPLTVIEAFQSIMNRPGGFSNFYSGLGVTLVGSMPSVALYFGVYSYCKKVFAKTEPGKKYPLASVAVSAAIGNTVASFSRVPYEVLKQKLQTQAYSNTWEALRDMTSSSQKFWSLVFPKGGVAIQMLRDIPYAIVTLMLYETLQSSFHKSRSNKAIDFCIGGASGGMGSWVTTPMDVIKTRLQTDSDLYGGSVMKCAKALWVEGGAPAFLRGSVPRLMHKVPANSFFFLFYEVFRRLLGVEDAKKSSKSKE